MKSFIVFAVLVAAALAAPANPDADAQITAYESDNIGVDGYRYKSETSNGISIQEEGVIENQGTEDEALLVRGGYSYTGPDNIVYAVTYTAGRNGFEPRGAHLPVAP